MRAALLLLGFATAAGTLAQTTTSLTAPANNNVYFSPATITLRASASAIAPEMVTRVDFYANGALIGTDASRAFSFVWTNAAPGTYTLASTATDSAGGQASSATRTITINAANLAPTVNLTAPANNAVFVLPATVTLKAGARAPEANDTVAKVEFCANGTLIGTDTSRAFSLTWTDPDPGSYALTAVATDGQGAQTTSAARTVRIDATNLPPTVHLTSPANKAIFNAPATIILKAGASAPEANDTVTRVDFFDGTTLVGTATAAPYGATIADAAPGTHVLTAVATDGYGAQSTSATRTVTVNEVNQPPTVALTSPANGATFTAPEPVPLAASASDGDGSIARVDFFQGATLLGTATSAPYTFSWTNVAPGSYAITARATDNGGAVTSSAVVSVTVNSGVARVYYIVPDHLNTPRLIADATGNTVWRWDQGEPFGNDVPNNNPSGAGAFEFNLRFPGQYFDRETNLAYNMRRDYSAEIGRYIEPDPLGVKMSALLYDYAKQNPLGVTDPLGLCPCAGGTWDESVGDWQVSVAFGGYFSVGRVNYSCRSNPGLKCTAKQVCIGGGAIVGIGLGFNAIGTVHDAGDSRDLGGWGDPQVVANIGPVGIQGGTTGGGNVGVGPGIGAGVAPYVRCYTKELKCNCQCDQK